MGKRQPPLVYNGSTIKYFWGYLNKYHMFLNPKDYYAVNYGMSLSHNINFGKQKFPGTSEIDFKVFPITGKDNHSHVVVTWITKMEKKFYIHSTDNVTRDLYAKIKYYNDICEDDRNMDNQDDEPEDEISLIT